MKKVLNTIGDFLVAWAEAMHEYRSRNKGYRNGGYY
jgi:hypothetical protein